MTEDATTKKGMYFFDMVFSFLQIVFRVFIAAVISNYLLEHHVGLGFMMLCFAAGAVYILNPKLNKNKLEE